jgi:hypothetical protein
MPVWAIRPLQECHCSVLLVGTIGPASLPVARPDGAGLGPVFCGAAAVDAGEVQAVTVSSAAATTVSATAPPRTALRSRLRLGSRLRSWRGIDMAPIMP